MAAYKQKLDRLHALLKIACLKRDKYQCVMCGRPVTRHPIHEYDNFDVSHIFAKSVWPLARFNMLNVKILCRKDCQTSRSLDGTDDRVDWRAVSKPSRMMWVRSRGEALRLTIVRKDLHTLVALSGARMS